MKKFLALFLGVFLISGEAISGEVNSEQAENFIKNLTDTGIEEIINSDVSEEEKDQRFEKLFNENLDLDFIGRFVLGRYWRTATAEERKEFINVYRELNIKTWSSRFDEFKGKSFIFKGTSPSSSAGQIFVNTEVPMDQGAPAKVVWRVKENKGQFKVVDIIIENVSLAITARNEYTAFIKNSPEGVQGLINNLKSKLQNQ